MSRREGKFGIRNDRRGEVGEVIGARFPRSRATGEGRATWQKRELR
jgi:hypothetical protein